MAVCESTGRCLRGTLHRTEHDSFATQCSTMASRNGYWQRSQKTHVIKSINVDNGCTAWLRMCLNSVTIFCLSLSSMVETANGDCHSDGLCRVPHTHTQKKDAGTNTGSKCKCIHREREGEKARASNGQTQGTHVNRTAVWNGVSST